jgi:type II secretory pathway pseudopilin PulG
MELAMARLSSERGSLLVEVMVGAVVLAIATTAILTGLDGSQATGLRNKDRSVAATLAQQDIERLRSLPITSISNLDETRTVRVGSVDFSVRSKTDWVRDSSGVVSCTDDSTQAEYLKIASTVDSPASRNYPVEETTLLTPAPGAFAANTGTAAVLLTDRDGNPLSGVRVSLAGPSNFSEDTNELGCAIFGYIPSGDYTATASGGVSWNGEVPPSAPVTVNPGRTSLTQIEIDQPGSLRAVFIKPAGSPVTLSARAGRISVAHAKFPNGVKSFPVAGPTTPTTSLVADNLFPHRDAYGVYAGDCEAHNPALWDSNYFRPGVPGYIVLDPGDFEESVNVTMPSLRVQVRRPTSGTSSGTGSWTARIKLRQIDSPVYLPSEPLLTDVDCTVVITPSSGTSQAASGTVPASFDFVLPFGHYRTVVDNNVNSGSSRRSAQADLNLTDPNHEAALIQLPNSNSGPANPSW